MQRPYVVLQLVLPRFDPGIWQASSSARQLSVQAMGALVRDFDDEDPGFFVADSAADVETRRVAFWVVIFSGAATRFDLALVLSAFGVSDSLVASALCQG
jgi:hypothetical protein